MTRPCCSTTCCPGGAKGASAILAAVAVIIVTVAVLAHILLLAVAAAVAAACWAIAVAMVIVIARYTVKPLVTAPQPEPYHLTATVIPQAVTAAQHPGLAAQVPAIENHYGPVFKFYGAEGEAQAARVIRQALMGEPARILTEGES